MKRLYELHGEGRSIREIARTLGVSRNTVRRYLRSPEVPRPAPRAPRRSKLDPYKEFIRQRVAEGVENCVVLLRELKAQGYTGSYTLLKEFVRPLRRGRSAPGTVRFDTSPGQQAQVDWGSCAYTLPDGSVRRKWVFAMVLSWSRAVYAEFTDRADTATFIRCHLNAFQYFGGVPETCLYDRTKLVVLGQDEHGELQWNERFLDFSLRLGFAVRLCQGYRPQTKGRVESAIKYIKGNFWPGVRFTDLEDLNRQVQAWCDRVANVRIHGTTHERPADRLAVERGALRPLPPQERLRPWLREERQVGRDGFVQWERAWYGVPYPWRPGQRVQVEAHQDVVELWVGDQRVAVHPRAQRPGQRFSHPRQWAGMPAREGRPPREPRAMQWPAVKVEERSLEEYAAVAEAVSRR